MEPQTAAGRALLLSIGRDEPDDWDDLDWSQVVAGIEAEARAAAERDVAALRQRVETEWYNGNVDLGARERILAKRAAEPKP